MARKAEIPHALISLRPGCKWACRGERYEDIEWMEVDIACPSEQEILAEVAKIQAEYDAIEYRSLRAKAYPTIGDQLDDLFKSGAFSTEMAELIQSVKDQYPKPTVE
jgi:hypothetical protein